MVGQRGVRDVDPRKESGHGRRHRRQRLPAPAAEPQGTEGSRAGADQRGCEPGGREGEPPGTISGHPGENRKRAPQDLRDDANGPTQDIRRKYAPRRPQKRPGHAHGTEQGDEQGVPQDRTRRETLEERGGDRQRTQAPHRGPDDGVSRPPQRYPERMRKTGVVPAISRESDRQEKKKTLTNEKKQTKK